MSKIDYLVTFDKEINEIANSLKVYLQNIPNGSKIEDIRDKLIWIKDYIDITGSKDYIHMHDIPDLYRGDVVLVKLGENLGMEFSGDHPSIVLRNSKKANNQVLILPITTQKPDGYDPKINNIYLEIGAIPHLTGFIDSCNSNNPDNGKHWANILNVKSISKDRIYYPPDKSKVDGNILTKISGAISTQIALVKKKKFIQDLNKNT